MTLQFAFRPQLVHMIHSGLTRQPSIRPFKESLDYLKILCSQISNGISDLYHQPKFLVIVRTLERADLVSAADEIRKREIADIYSPSLNNVF